MNDYGWEVIPTLSHKYLIRNIVYYGGSEEIQRVHQ